MNKDKRFIQGTPEWLEFRRNGVFASDVPIIMGVSPWTTPLELYWMKVEGIELDETPAMKRGKDLEPIARRWFEMIVGSFVNPAVITRKDFTWMGASLDGINDKGILVEIKCPGKEDHEVALGNTIPLKYYPQLQYQMFVCDLQKMYYVSYLPGHDKPCALVEVERSSSYEKEMLAKVKSFYHCLSTGVPPKPTSKEKIKDEIGPPKTIVDHADLLVEENLAYVSGALEEAKLRVKALQDEFDELKTYVTSKFENCPYVGEKLIFTPTVRKGLIDYPAIPGLRCIDLEIYRKPPIKGWKIEFIE